MTDQQEAVIVICLVLFAIFWFVKELSWTNRR